VSENSPSGELIVRVHAVHPDPVTDPLSQIQYSFNRNTLSLYGQLFGICEATGQIHVKGLIDYEKKSMYMVCVYYYVYVYCITYIKDCLTNEKKSLYNYGVYSLVGCVLYVYVYVNVYVDIKIMYI